MAAEYQVNIKLNTQQFKTELGKLQNVVKDAGTINLAPTKQQASALKLQSKEIKDQTKQIRLQQRLEDQRDRISARRSRFMRQVEVLETKGVKVRKIRNMLGKQHEGYRKQEYRWMEKQGNQIANQIALSQQKLRIEKLTTAEIRKQQNQGLGLRRLGDRAGRISRRAGPQLALPSSQLIQEQRSAEFTARANERTARAYARSAERGKEVLAASQASAKAAEQHYRWVEKRGAVGAPSSPLNVVDGRVRPGRQGWLSRMQQQNPGRFQLGAAGQGAMISGAFPLLFGQGPGVAAAGALGGGLGGFLGGQGGAFAGGLVATAVASQIGAAVDSLRNLGDALKDPTKGMQQLEQMGLKVSDSLKKQVNGLLEIGKAREAQALINKKVAEVIGGQGVLSLQKLDTAFDDLADKTGKLFLQLANQLAPALTQIITLTTKFVAALSGPDSQRRVMNLDSEEYYRMQREADRYAGKEMRRRYPLFHIDTRDERKSISEQRLNELTQEWLARRNNANSLVPSTVTDDISKDPVESLRKQRELLEKNFRLSEGLFKIESDITKMKERGLPIDEEAYRKEAQLVEQLQAQRQLYLEIAQTIKQGIVNSIEAAITGARSLSDVLRSIVQSVGRSFLNAAINAGVGALTSSWGNTTNIGPKPPVIPRASGGYIDNPEVSLVGEGGESEYIIPASKMDSALTRYSQGARGESVLDGSGGEGLVEEGSSSTTGTIDVRFTSERINEVSYVTYEQFQMGVQEAAKQGAQRGEQATLSRLRNNPSTRRAVGI